MYLSKWSRKREEKFGGRRNTQKDSGQKRMKNYKGQATTDQRS